MKRTNLVLDEHLLEELQAISGQPTYSAAVNEAMAEYCRIHRVKKLYALQGSGIWEGNLSNMRADYAPKKPSARSPKAKPKTPSKKKTDS